MTYQQTCKYRRVDPFICINETTTDQHSVEAPRAGIVFYATTNQNGELENRPNEDTKVYVVSPFDTYESFSAWVKAGEGEEDAVDSENSEDLEEDEGI